MAFRFRESSRVLSAALRLTASSSVVAATLALPLSCTVITDTSSEGTDSLRACSGDGDCSDAERCVAGSCMSGGSEGPYVPPREVANPSGDCVATNDGSGIEHVPGPSTVYLPDCEAPLAREYYRVFVQEDDTAYMIPRPDNHPDFARICAAPEDPLKAVLERYDLCQVESFDSEQIARVNAMTPEDALAIAHFLHENLVFVPREYGVFPGPRAEDILELCETDQTFRNGPLRERCDFELEARAGGSPTVQGWLHTGEAGEVLADALNTLYGISGDALCERVRKSAVYELAATLDAARGPCSEDADCTEVARATSCFVACGDAVASENLSEVERAKGVIEASQCAAFERAGCTVLIPPCDPSGPASCIDGTCL